MTIETHADVPRAACAAVLALCSFLFCTNLVAADRVALVIGNAAYEEAPLKNPVNDARALSANMTETLTPLGITVGRWRFNRWQQREKRWH